MCVTATKGADYQDPGTTVVFGPTEKTKNIQVTFINDVDVEGNETIQIQLTDGLWYELGTTAQHTLTIQDDDD